MTEGWLPVAAFGAGIASSTGPCIAPRFLAAASLCTGTLGTRRWLRLGAFVAGSSLSYVAACSTGGVIARMGACSIEMYALLAMACVTTGVVNIARTHACAIGGRPQPCGIAFFWGGVAGLVGSPCCGPLVALAALGWSTAGRDPLVLAAFALGHAAPLLGLTIGCGRIEKLVRPRWPVEATATVSGGLAIALGAYYAVLA